MYRLLIVTLICLLSNTAHAGILMSEEIKGFSDRNYKNEDAARRQALEDAIWQASERVAGWLNQDWSEIEYVWEEDSIVFYGIDKTRKAASFRVNNIGFITTGEYMIILDGTIYASAIVTYGLRLTEREKFFKRLESIKPIVFVKGNAIEGRPIIVQLKIDFDMDFKLLNRMQDDSKDAIYPCLTGVVEAVLSSSKLKVFPTSKTEQVFNESGINIWSWEVIPQRTGEVELFININSKVNVGGHISNRPFPPFSQRLEVAPSYIRRFTSFFGRNWQWVLGTIIVPLVVFFGRRYLSKRTTKKDVENL